MSHDPYLDGWQGGSLDDEDIGMGMPCGKYARMDGCDEMNENKERFARENHSEIERRRRNKMTHYINELAEMVPQCAALGRKPDKLTILRMAVSHMKAIRGQQQQDETNYKPSFLSDQELKHLILEAANGFLFVVCCQTSRIIYVADSIVPVLNMKPEDWLHRQMTDLVHPDDHEKLRDQLCGGEVAASKFLDLKTGAVKKDNATSRIHMSCRRGFIVRMRVGPLEPLHRLRNRRPIFQYGGHNYVVMHCTGYIKNAAPAGIDAQTSSCLVAIARLQVASMPPCVDPTTTKQFSVRIAEDGKTTFVDPKAAQILGLGVDQLIGRVWWQLAHPADEQLLQEAFVALLRDQPMRLNIRLRTQNDYVQCTVSAYKFVNPYSEQFEYVVATHQIHTGEPIDDPNMGPGPMWQPGNGNLPPAGPYSAPTDPTAAGLPPYGAQDWQSQPTSGESSAGSRNTQPDPWAQQWGTDSQMFHPSI
ncbi:hypothetical protein WR25_21984 [Diploscapter pachys]|uniref:Aryl hydrocarbon receptor nuclear translocator homolog n=1 Tax=Diploscapter pachys TaxID=2018661 RepID=A0A2A2L9H2_9BILA|nr:hypothetical protein WR25_21984 [Diploscapter pachys]